MLKQLKCGYSYKSVISAGVQDFDSDFLNHLSFAQSGNDKLASNYNLKHISRMVEYGYVYNNNPSDLVYMVGIEDFQNGAFRIESRLFVHPNYRKTFWKSPDNYEVVKHQINIHNSKYEFLFKSREAKNPAGFRISARLDNFFKDWTIHPNQIELRYKNNWQWIMYNTIKGSVNEHIEKLLH